MAGVPIPGRCRWLHRRGELVMNATLPRIMKYVFSRVVILYLTAFAVAYFFLDHKAAKGHAYGATLSRLQPAYDYLTQYSDGKAPYDRKKLAAYRLFFSHLVDIMPGRFDGYAMLGF